MAVAVRLAGEELLRLPFENLVGHALEGLAEHDEATGRGLASAEVEVTEPAFATTGAPFDGEDDEIERAGGLDLDPRRTAAAGCVRRGGKLGHESFVTAGNGIGLEALGLGDVRSR